jgi:hypothetical protein
MFSELKRHMRWRGGPLLRVMVSKSATAIDCEVRNVLAEIEKSVALVGGAFMTVNRMHVAVVDVGKLENLGWAIKGPVVCRSGSDIDESVEALTDALTAGPLALGFEAPMFVPYRHDVSRLDKCRNNEGSRSFSASAGACVLAKGLVICPYILSTLRQRVPNARATFNWRRPLSAHDLLLFEAFVTHETADHVGCAKLAIGKFQEGMKNPATFKSNIDEPDIFNLLGAMLLRTSWSNDVGMLTKPCLVVRHKGTAKPRKRRDAPK